MVRRRNGDICKINISQFHKQVLLSAKLQIVMISLSATPINRRCGFLFGKVSSTTRPSSSAVRQKRENGRHEMGANVYFKPLRDSEFGKVYWFPSPWSSYTTAVRVMSKKVCKILLRPSLPAWIPLAWGEFVMLIFICRPEFGLSIFSKNNPTD